MRTLIAAAALAALLAACDRTPTPSVGEAEAPAAPASPTAGAPPSASVPAPAQTPQTPAPAPASGEQGGAEGWRAVASAADASKLGRLDEAWRLARAEAEEQGFADEVEALGPLVDPNAGQAGRLQPAPGTYRCRTVQMGSTSLAFVAYPFFRCVVELTPGGDLILTKTTGSQRTRGLLYPDTDRRLVFVGAQAWGSDETGYPAYGDQAERDQVGVFERIGPQRWRVVVPWPSASSKLEIMELAR